MDLWENPSCTRIFGYLKPCFPFTHKSVPFIQTPKKAIEPFLVLDIRSSVYSSTRPKMRKSLLLFVAFLTVLVFAAIIEAKEEAEAQDIVAMNKDAQQ